MKRVTGFLAAMAMVAVLTNSTNAQTGTASGRQRGANQEQQAQRLAAAQAALETALKELEAKPDDAVVIEAAIKAYQGVQSAAGRNRAAQRSATQGLAELVERVIEGHKDNPTIVAAYIQAQQAKLGRIRGNFDERLEGYRELTMNVERFQLEDEQVQTALANFKRTANSGIRTITAERTRAELIGQPAPPIPAGAVWINGEAMTPADLEGKVIFLDFWAVWCGPCIATFPHLREWNEKYADQGLVMIGATRYYNYGWDDENQRPQRVEEISPVDERAGMVKFAEHHELKHRFAVMENTDFGGSYGLTGIPQAVVIDREGKVRMIRVGSGAANAEALDGLLRELFDDTDDDGDTDGDGDGQ